MDAFAECEEQKERVKACYADWFQKIWGGDFDKARCDQQTQDFRQCVEAVMQRQADKKKRDASDKQNEWMDRTKDKSDEAIRQARERVQRAREEKENVKGGVKDKAADVGSKVQEAADHWKSKIKGLAGKDDKKHDYDD